MIDDEINAALVRYAGRGEHQWPHALPDALLHEFGAARGQALLVRIEELLRELFELTPDWRVHSLEMGTDWVVSSIAKKHPELNKDGLGVLGWIYSFNCK